MSNKKVRPQDVVNVPTPVGEPRYVNVKVLDENGVFKQGELHEKDSEFVMELFAAENAERVGSVEILSEVENA